jgi:hypothetical protein
VRCRHTRECSIGGQVSRFRRFRRFEGVCGADFKSGGL